MEGNHAPKILEASIRDVKFGEGVTIVNPVNIYDVTLDDGVFVGPFVEIQKGAVIGAHTRIQSHAFVCDKVRIGKNCFISHGVTFINDTFSKGFYSRDPTDWKETILGNDVCVGSNATILPVRICDKVIIGAGSVVTKDITEAGAYAGVPAVKVGTKRKASFLLEEEAPKVKPTVVIIGHGSLASMGLKLIKSDMGIDVPFVVADSADDGTDGWRISFAKTARSLGYKDGETLFQPNFPHSKEVLAKLKEVNPTLILSLQCQKIIRKSVVETAQLGCVNCHNAPLPLLRGCDPFAWAIHDGLLRMGVTLHQVPDEGIDSGPIFCQTLWPIEADTTAWDLYTTALDKAMVLIKANLDKILTQEIKAVPQAEELVTYHPMKQIAYRPLDMDWSLPVATLSAFARARVFPPIQLPCFMLAGKKLHAVKVDVAEDVKVFKKDVPGTVMALTPLTIAARWGALRVHHLRVDGETYEKKTDYVETNEDLAKKIGYALGDKAC